MLQFLRPSQEVSGLDFGTLADWLPILTSC
jgi:hypothetical protein